jgi:hypothetical protein
MAAAGFTDHHDQLARIGAPTTDGSPTGITALGFETGAARAILRQIHQAHLM